MLQKIIDLLDELDDRIQCEECQHDQGQLFQEELGYVAVKGIHRIFLCGP